MLYRNVAHLRRWWLSDCNRVVIATALEMNDMYMFVAAVVAFAVAVAFSAWRHFFPVHLSDA